MSSTKIKPSIPPLTGDSRLTYVDAQPLSQATMAE